MLSFGKWSGCQPTHYTLHGGDAMRGPTPTAPVKIVPVIWGTSAPLGFTAGQFDSFFANSFGGSSWWSWIRREYHLPNVVESPWVTLNLSAHAKTTSPVSEKDIRDEVLAHLNDGSLPLYGGGSNAESMLYVIHIPGNVEVRTDGDPNMWYCAGADGTHKQGDYYYPCAADATSLSTTFAGVPIRMVIMPDQTSTKCKSHCDPNNTRTALEMQTMTESHEIVGACCRTRGTSRTPTVPAAPSMAGTRRMGARTARLVPELPRNDGRSGVGVRPSCR